MNLSQDRQNNGQWLLLALLAQTLWGMWPVIGRYLQTIGNLPTASILVVGTSVVWLWFLFHTLPTEGIGVLRSPTMLIMVCFAAARAITNLLAVRFTLAIYAQVIALLAPYIIVLLNRFFLKDKVPAGTLPAIIVSIFGALLMLSGDLTANGLRFNLTNSDYIGLSLAFLSTLFLAGWMLSIRKTASTKYSAITTFAVQSIGVWTFNLGVSLGTGEDWSRWLELEPAIWLAVAAHIVLIIIGANTSQITAIRHLGAPTVSALLPWRLISTMTVSYLLLGERLQTWYQSLGAVIVLFTVSTYLWRQRAD